MPPGFQNTLQQQLDQITENTRALVPAERLARTEENVTELLATGIESHGLFIGSIAPNFNLLGANGKVVRSEDLLALGPVILKFFRGRWCPYDITELEAWQALLPRLRQPPHGSPAVFVAISPQTPRQNAFTAQSHDFTFPLLSDPEAQLAAQFRLDYVVPEKTRAWYRSMLVNIPMLYGNESWRLPLPATIVLSPEGTIVFSEAYADHRLRPDPQAVLEALYSLAVSPPPHSTAR